MRGSRIPIRGRAVRGLGLRAAQLPVAAKQQPSLCSLVSPGNSTVTGNHRPVLPGRSHRVLLLGVTRQKQGPEDEAVGTRATQAVGL